MYSEPCFLPNAVDYFALSRPVGRLMLLCREMHSFNGLVHVCMQWLARNEQGRGTVVPLMRPLTWEGDGARAQRFFLKSVQDVSAVLNSLGSFPVVMYCEKILGVAIGGHAILIISFSQSISSVQSWHGIFSI